MCIFPQFFASFTNLFHHLALFLCEEVERARQWDRWTRDMNPGHLPTVTFTNIPAGKIEFMTSAQSVMEI